MNTWMFISLPKHHYQDSTPSLSLFLGCFSVGDWPGCWCSESVCHHRLLGSRFLTCDFIIVRHISWAIDSTHPGLKRNLIFIRCTPAQTLYSIKLCLKKTKWENLIEIRWLSKALKYLTETETQLNGSCENVQQSTEMPHNVCFFVSLKKNKNRSDQRIKEFNCCC